MNLLAGVFYGYYSLLVIKYTLSCQEMVTITCDEGLCLN